MYNKTVHTTAAETTNSAYIESGSSHFWQRVFAIEADYLATRLQGCRTVLSVGSGSGDIEGQLTGRGFHLTAVDPSPRLLARTPRSANPVQARAESLPFLQESFDAVVFVASLQFIADFRQALQNAARVLNARGRLVLLLLNPQSAFFRERAQRQCSYFAQIRHRYLQPITDYARHCFRTDSEFILGLGGDEPVPGVFGPTEAALLAVHGEKIGEPKS